jgi:hypothetical protein
MRCFDGNRMLVWAFIIIVVTPVCAHAQSLTATAITACLKSSIHDNQPIATIPVYVNKRVVKIIHAIACTGDVAENMWNQLYPYHVGAVTRFKSADNETHGQFKFGKNSVCVRRIYNSEHRPAPDGFSCYISLDLTDTLDASLH